VKPDFLSAVVDTLFPGDGGSPPLPSATAVGLAAKLGQHLVADRDALRHQAVLHAIAQAAGGEESFWRADTAGRVAAVRQVEVEMRGSFQPFVMLLLQDYYEAESVLVAMGWRAEPPQPRGHALPPFDEALLAPVKRRGRMWR
jgi:hypothetical protein